MDVNGWVTIVFVLTGALLCLVAGVGVLRLPDVFDRMHAATKPATLGLLCICIGTAVRIVDVDDYMKLFLVILFQFITIPVAGHALGHAVYRSRSRR